VAQPCAGTEEGAGDGAWPVSPIRGAARRAGHRGTGLPRPRRSHAREIVRDAATTHYVLALSWSPEWCHTHGDDPNTKLECRDNHFGLTLHGLWPSNADGRHPRFCGRAPALTTAEIRPMICATPSLTLLQHEWAAHGTCGWPTAAAYFRQADALWDAIRRPDLSLLAPSATAGAVRRQLLAANPHLPAKAINLRVASGNRLNEIFICYDLRFRPAACPMGTGTPDRVRVRIAPRRGPAG
jgi:ribonuclease T2